jgi:hypothetical protein
VQSQEFYQLLDKDGITDDIHLFNDKLREWEDSLQPQYPAQQRQIRTVRAWRDAPTEGRFRLPSPKLVTFSRASRVRANVSNPRGGASGGIDEPADLVQPSSDLRP